MAVVATAHALSGTIGGVVAMTLLYPLDNIRTRLQVSAVAQQVKHQHQTHGENGKIPQQPQQLVSLTNGAPQATSTTPCQLSQQNKQSQHTSTLELARRVLQEEGWQGLYGGLNSALLGITVSSSVYFFWYSMIKSMWTRGRKQAALGPFENLAVASLAGFVNCCITQPFWVINTRLTLQQKKKEQEQQKQQPQQQQPQIGKQSALLKHTEIPVRVQSQEFTGIVDAFCKIYQHEGVQGLFRGLVASVILVSNPAIQFLVYEQLTTLVKQLRLKASVSTNGSSAASSPDNSALSAVDYFLLAAVAKAVATLLTYPYQVVKSRLQSGRWPYEGTMDAIHTMWKTEGASSFFQGMPAKMSQTVLNAAFTFATYEKTLQIAMKLVRSSLKLFAQNPKHQY